MAPWKTYSKVLQGDGKSFSKGIWNMRHVSCFCTNLCFPITPGAWHTPVLCRVWYVKTPSLAINTDRSLLCFWWHGMARHVLSFLWLHLDWCISMSLSQPWLFFFFDDLLQGAEFLFIPEIPVSTQLVIPLGTSGLCSWCSWKIYTPTPSWGIIIAIKAETSISREQNFHITIKML